VRHLQSDKGRQAAGRVSPGKINGRGTDASAAGSFHLPGALRRQNPGGLLRGLTPRLYLISHGIDQVGGDHGVTAHGGDLKDILTGQFLRLAPRLQREVGGMVLQPGLLQALVSLLEDATHHHGKPQVRLLKLLQNPGYRSLIIKHGMCQLAGIGHDGLPLAGVQPSLVNMADVHRVVLENQLEEILQLRLVAAIVYPHGGYNQNYKVFAQTLGSAATMQGVRHYLLLKILKPSPWGYPGRHSACH
jgi:hypothetical protein